MRSSSILALPLALVAGCLGSGGGMPAPSGSGLTLFPTTVYTGFEAGGGASYAVPIGASGASGMSWTSSNSGVAGVSGGDTEAMVDGVKDGTAQVTASAGAQSVSATVIVVGYTAAQRTAGAQSYTKYNCGGCHAGNGSDITPSGIGKHSDEQILAAATQGANPEGGDVSIGRAAHSFAADPGIVAYVRSLAPAGIPHADK